MRSDRRAFLAQAAAGFAGALAGARPGHADRPQIEAFIRRRMEADHIPGVAACILKRGAVVWSAAYGFANLDERKPMTLDTLQNIGSISKTIATTALMQLWEKGRFKLEDDVSRYLSFPVRNPAHPGEAITFRYLLTHTSSIRDGPVYAQQYGCGDPRMPLGEWLRQYLAPGGGFYRAAENFHPWELGKKWDYCNVAYGLAGHLVESIAGTPFPEYCRQAVFEPLELNETSWYLAGIDPARHAVPYSWVSSKGIRGPSWGGVAQGVLRDDGKAAPAPTKEGYEANCLYGHPNYPDGFLRTSVSQLARYVSAYLRLGRFEKSQILRPDTIREMLTPQLFAGGRVQGLTWYGLGSPGDRLPWGHTGSDPGINTDLRFRLYDGAGAIVFANTNGIKPEEITTRLLRESDAL